MAVQNQNANLKTYGVAPEEISFYLVGQGSGALTFGAGCPGGFFVSGAHTATGKFTVVLSTAVQAVIAWEVNPDGLASPDGSWAEIGNIQNEGTSNGLTFQLAFYTPGGGYAQVPLADPAVGRKIRVRLRIQRTKWGVMT